MGGATPPPRCIWSELVQLLLSCRAGSSLARLFLLGVSMGIAIIAGVFYFILIIVIVAVFRIAAEDSSDE